MNVDFFGNDDDGFASVIIPNGYQQADNPPPRADVEWDWFQEIDDDSWIIGEANSAPVGAGLPNTARLPEDAFPHADETIEHVVSSGGYQQADVAPPPSPSQFFGDAAELLEEAIEPTIQPAGFQQADVAVVASQFFETPFDWEDSPPDYMADDFGNDDADPPVADAWDWSHHDDDEQAVPDDPIGASVAVATIQPPDDAFEAPQDADDDEWTARNSDPVGPNAIAYAPYDDGWDWLLDEADNDFDWALEPNVLVTTVAPSTLLPRITVRPNADRTVVPSASRKLP